MGTFIDKLSFVVALSIVLVVLFANPSGTANILQSLFQGGGSFVTTLQGR